MDIQNSEAVAGEPWEPLVDVNDLSLRELLEDSSSPLAGSVKRVVASLDHPDGIIAAFANYAPPR